MRTTNKLKPGIEAEDPAKADQFRNPEWELDLI